MGDVRSFNFADVWEAIADAVPDAEALVCGERRLTYAALEERANRLAQYLLALGVAAGDFVGCHMTNGTEYLETLLAAFKIRAVPVNINYRYVEGELEYLFNDAGIVVLVADQEFAPRIEAVAPRVPTLRHVLTRGAAYEAALAAASPLRPEVERSEDDRYVIYTGGTTGMPKGVVWRQGDAFFGCLGGGDPMRLSGPVSTPSEMLERLVTFDFTFLALAPLMHAAAQWVSLMWLFCGARVVLHSGSFDPVAVWRTIEAEHVSTTTVVGDAMARPLLDAWDEHGPFDVSSLFAFSNGGAPLTPALKARLHEIMPNVVLTDGFGSSETGIQGSQRLQPGGGGPGRLDATRFENVSPHTAVLDAGLQPIVPGSGVVGRVAHSGHLPIGYHRAPEKTAETFVEVEGRRWVLSGDLATVDADGSIVLLGRGSVSINTGGEKVYPEEVEAALKTHPSVYDALVVGVPDERFGERVCAVVQPSAGATPTLDGLVEHCRSLIAGYKLPRRLVLVDRVERSPAGKADYRWAKATAAAD